MKLSEIKNLCNEVETLNFKLKNGTIVPENFHVTEIGVITKNFIDCGGNVRNEKVANFQLWDANDFEHKLKPGKLLKIIELSEKVLGMDDLEIEVEFQTETIGKYNLSFDGKNFILNSKATACLALENCGIVDSSDKGSCCSSESKCC